MRSAAGDRIVLLALAGLIVASPWLKSLAAAGAPPAPTGLLERLIAGRLTARGFAAAIRRLPLGSMVIEAKRGGCVVMARDASGARGAEASFSRAAQAIGPVAYLYDGRPYPATPILPMRIDRFKREAARLIGIRAPMRVPIALAASRPCGNDFFGLADIRLPT